MESHTCTLEIHDKCANYIDIDWTPCHCPCHVPTERFERGLRQLRERPVTDRRRNADMGPSQHSVHRLLRLIQNGLFPGTGMEQAKITRQICEQQGWDEDEYLPTFISKNKKAWGL